MITTEQLQRLFQVMVAASLGELFWYAVLAFAVWLFFYVLFRNALRWRKISTQDATSRQIAREIAFSLRSIAIYGLVTAAVVYARMHGWTLLYLEPGKFGWLWLFGSVLVMVVIHDAYFYWTHRLMHHKRLYRYFHRTHHLSTSPTPWAAYAFSPAEALVQAGIGPLIVFTIPSHPAAFGIFMIWQIGFNVVGHCGYEVWPNWFLRSPLGKILNTVTHHGLHHEKFRGNYGLYFNFWDRVMGTNHPQYVPRFELATGGVATPISTPVSAPHFGPSPPVMPTPSQPETATSRV
ncbi:MAG: sterol desaturase family protein [Pirellulaceae bacterium]